MEHDDGKSSDDKPCSQLAILSFMDSFQSVNYYNVTSDYITWDALVIVFPLHFLFGTSMKAHHLSIPEDDFMQNSVYNFCET